MSQGTGPEEPARQESRCLPVPPCPGSDCCLTMAKEAEPPGPVEVCWPCTVCLASPGAWGRGDPHDELLPSCVWP